MGAATGRAWTTATMHRAVSIDDVKAFWEQNPLCAAAIPHEIGTEAYFRFYDELREKNESIEFSYQLHEYPDFNGKRVLDVGSGNGYVLSKYAREGAEVHGVDITETGVELCRKRFELEGLSGHFQVANAEHLPFDDQSFDCVCSMGVLHHVPDTERAVSEVHRVLKKGGRLIVMFYHRNSAWYQVKMRYRSWFVGKSMEQLVDEVDGEDCPKGDVYSRKELRELLRGFDSIEMFAGLLNAQMILPFSGFFLPDAVFKPLERRLGWFLYAKGCKRG